MFNDNIVRILEESSQTLSRNGWSRHAMARDAAGNSCSLSSGDAVAYCVWASVVKSWRKLDPQNENFYFSFFERKFAEVLSSKYRYRFTLTRWNDEVASSARDAVTLIDDVIATVFAAPQAIVLEPDVDKPAAADWSFGLSKPWRVADRSASRISASTTTHIF